MTVIRLIHLEHSSKLDRPIVHFFPGALSEQRDYKIRKAKESKEQQGNKVRKGKDEEAQQAIYVSLFQGAQKKKRKPNKRNATLIRSLRLPDQNTKRKDEPR